MFDEVCMEVQAELVILAKVLKSSIDDGGAKNAEASYTKKISMIAIIIAINIPSSKRSISVYCELTLQFISSTITTFL